MKRFSEMPYARPDQARLEQQFGSLLRDFDNAPTAELQYDILQQVYTLRAEVETMARLAMIRHTKDMTSPQYEAEQNALDAIMPAYRKLVNDFYQSLIRSRFRGELAGKWGPHIFTIAELSTLNFRPEIVDDLRRENALVSEYETLLTSAEIEFAGKERNLSGMSAFEQSVDRDMRRQASEARWSFFESHADEFDAIFSQLIEVRTQMARKLGHPNFVGLGYARMLRSDYDAEMVKDFRRQIRDEIVPLANRLLERKARRLGLDHLKYYDESLEFLSGNAKPQGDTEWIAQVAGQVFAELSPQTGEFFSFMVENELMDLESRKGKAHAGYCEDLSKYGAPFIFVNFTGTADDVEMLVHELGHAFQYYNCRDFIPFEYRWPTLEACEIHAMSMPFLTWPWMDAFFGEDAAKFRFSHVSRSILNLPYRCAVDEFQHAIYENPEATPAERRRQWRAIEKIYLPRRDYDNNAFLESGGSFHPLRHIYAAPFYFIDYNLADACAFQFWARAEKDRQQTFDDFLALCKAGGTLPLLQLVKRAGLTSPFSEGCLKAVRNQAEAWLENPANAIF
jgi:M3 family oligoendopeptidase